MEHILEVKNMTKTYPGVVALNNFSFEVRKGECHALIGENGAGKSTLIKAIAGAIQPDSGKILFDGKEYDFMTPALSRQLGISVIYQEFNLCPSLSVAENIFLGNRIGNSKLVNFKELNRRAQEIIDRFGVKLKVTTLVRELSTAQQQLVEIAQAIANNSKLLIMDEPTAPLTERETSVLFKIIKELKVSGITIIYISHRLEELYIVSDRVTVMRDGNFIITDDTSKLSKEDLISHMVGRKLTKKFNTDHSYSDEILLETQGLGGNGDQPFSLQLHKGEILGLGGLVGAGRTEYAQMIFGAVRKDEGKILLNGKEIEINSPKDAVKHGIGMVPEERKSCGVFLRMNIEHNIVVSILKKISGAAGVVNVATEKNITQQQIDSLSIKTPSAKQLVQNLSGGNQQKVVIAKWLANNCQVLILDEPTRGIDVAAKQEIYDVINELSRQGKGIIVISSDMEEIMGITDRMLILYEGKYQGELKHNEYTQEKILKMASGMKEE